MSRYINIDKVLKELHLNHKDVIYIDKNDTAKRIEKIQGIDIVRCKECRHWYGNHFHDNEPTTCNMDKWTNPDDYCSYGKRKTEQAERAETMSCQECKWWFTDSLKHGGYCQSLLYNHECRYEPEVDCSWK